MGVAAMRLVTHLTANMIRMTEQRQNTAADRANQLLVEGLLQAGKQKEAIDLCLRICSAPGATPREWLMYGCLSADTGDVAKARAALEKSLELAPDFVEAQFALGKLLATAGNPVAAVAYLEKAAQLQPDNADIWLTLGITHGLAKQAAKAEECCRRSLELRPHSVDALFNLANALVAQGKLSEAETKYQSVLEMEPRMAMAWCRLSQTWIGLRRLAEAETAAARAIELEPRLGEAHFVLGSLLQERGATELARDRLRQAVTLLPRSPEVHLRLGQVLRRLGDLAGAEESFQMAVNLDAGMVDAHFMLGEVLHEKKSFAKAVASYINVVNLNNDHLQAHYRLAFILSTVGRHADAAQHFAEVLRINPEDEQARHLLAAQKGETTATAPSKYITTLFDGFADTFDSKLVETLNYHTPERLQEMISQLVSPAMRSLDILDIGCGTGLCGPLFRGVARTLHGVDLSPRMIEKARERNLYDSLEVGDITVSLQSRVDAWDLVISTDVFVYVGDLKAVFAACSTALRSGGYFAFSVEAGDDGETFSLRPTGRYAHATNYIRSLSAMTGFREIGRRAIFVRHEKGKRVPGYLFLLQRTAGAPP